MDKPIGFGKISVRHLIGGPVKLVPTAVGSVEGPATGANSTSGCAVSGSGLGATPALSGWISALTITSERTARDYHRRTIPVGLDCETASGRSISVSGRSKMASQADLAVGQLGAGKSMWRVRSGFSDNPVVTLKSALFCATLKVALLHWIFTAYKYTNFTLISSLEMLLILRLSYA